jgi:hypothetical protein
MGLGRPIQLSPSSLLRIPPLRPLGSKISSQRADLVDVIE